MSEETLLSASRRVLRFLDIDLNKGGFVTVETEAALDTLRIQIYRETKRQKAVENPDNAT